MSVQAGATVSMDLGRVLDHGRWSGFQKRVLTYAAMIFLVDGLANQSLGIVQPALIAAWGVGREAFAPVAAIGLIGVAVGTLIGGFLGDRMGRRTVLIVSVLLFGVMTAAGALAQNVETLMVVRFLDGLGIGGAIPCGAALIVEFTPIRRRSLAIAIGMAFIPAGGLVSGILGGAILPQFGWQAMFITCGALAVALAAIFLFVLPESPLFLMRNPAKAAALASLQRRLKTNASTEAGPLDTPPEQRPRASLAKLVGEGRLRDTLFLWAAFFLCLMASYTIFSWVPTMLAGMGFDFQRTSNSLTAFHSGGLAGGLVCGAAITMLGSRPAYLLVIGGAVAASLAMAGLLTQAEPDATLLLGMLMLLGLLVGGVHTAVYTQAAHLYPPTVRATGVGTASAMGRIGAVLSSFTGVATLNWGGPPVFFLAIAGMLAVCLVCGLLISHQIPRSGGRSELSS